ncbi:MAG TPA: valine--tRNA ligase [Actinomycetota bacterium]|nr:valine--tRNA ligase [Actinomycetota bacterium]
MSTKADELRAMEDRWRAYWEEAGVYRYDPARGRSETFVVDTPPPTVSGSLHIGHVCSYTHTDLMVRYRRMRGDNIFYPMGWDDNGLPTERRVQNVFNVRCDPTLPYDPALDLEFGRSGETLSVSRRNFIELCDRVITEDEKVFKDLFQRLGLSVDWDATYSYTTIDERCRRVSQASFLKLVEKGEAELRDAPTMWDIDFQSAVAQAEVEDREKEGSFYKIRFDVQGDDHVFIATTRPELIPACIALGCNPTDTRYSHLIGSTAITPLFRARVPIVAKEDADPEKGTGILMICTFGDSADVDDWRRLGLPAREIIDRAGRIMPAQWGEGHWESDDPDSAREHHEKLAGLSVNQARKEIVTMLAEADALDGEPESIRRPVKYYERGERPLEFIVTRQWFIKVLDKKAELIEQGRKVQWHPDLFRKRYEDWVEGLNQDWATSRQRYFGVPIPVWYRVKDDGSIDYEALLLPRADDLPVDPSTEAPPGFTEDQRGVAGGFVGDPDVFDTWATSSLTPLIPTGWPDAERFQNLYPTDLRPQAHEIIRTWAFYTIVRAMLEDGSVPWWHVAISGWVLDPERKKMSKSKGNVVLPTDVLDEFGSDAVRYWAGSARLGVDTAADPNVFREGKRLVTKLRNAARLIAGFEGDGGPPEHALDLGLLGRLRDVITTATDHWEAWDHAGALEVVERWFWDDFCDNYLELSKARAYDNDPSALGALRKALDVALRLFAPYLPFTTEELWNGGRTPQASIHVAAWPSAHELEGTDDGSFDVAVDVLAQIRKTKSESKVSIKTPVEMLRVEASESVIASLERVKDDVLAAGNVLRHEFIPDGASELTVTVELGTPTARSH